LHTDGAFEADPPKILALQCEIAAKDRGYSRILSGEILYEYLVHKSPESLLALFEADAFSIMRGNKQLSRPIFESINQKIYLAFRFDKSVTTFVKSQAQEAFNLAVDFMKNPLNQLIFKLRENQILVADNTRVLHGRTAFTGHRKLNRLWLDGSSTYKEEFEVGFSPRSEAGIKVFELAKTKSQKY
jgi:hypothetical protein